jgi:hypothetical protein
MKKRTANSPSDHIRHPRKRNDAGRRADRRVRTKTPAAKLRPAKHIATTWGDRVVFVALVFFAHR